jgi:hypothetical protein
MPRDLPVASGDEDERGLEDRAAANGQLEQRIEPVEKNKKCKK